MMLLELMDILIDIDICWCTLLFVVGVLRLLYCRIDVLYFESDLGD
jgi:hypothetical protein